jgi:hypothetical protein
MDDANEALEAWRSSETYRPLLSADASAWAWEFARRAAGGGPNAPAPPDLCFAGPGPVGQAAPAAMWRHETDPSVPLLHARACPSNDPTGLDVARLPLATLVVTSHGQDQHVLVVDGTSHLRFAVTGDDVLKGPVRLGFDLPSRGVGTAGLDAVRRLLVLRDRGGLPAEGRPRQRAERWVAAVRAIDARRAGASQREIAALLFGEARVREDWNGGSDYMRMRVQRLVRAAEALTAGGYRTLFGLSRSGVQGTRTREIWRSPAWRAGR